MYSKEDEEKKMYTANAYAVNEIILRMVFHRRFHCVRALYLFLYKNFFQ